MKRFRSLLLVLPLGLLSLAAVAAQTQARTQARTQTQAQTATAPTSFDIDPVHSTAIFRVHHLKAGQFYGRFNDVKGTFQFNEKDAEGLAFDITIDIESVDTNNDSLNNHLKSPDFFNAREFPTMRFKSRRATQRDATHYEVEGDLTIRGITKPKTVVMEMTGAADLGRGLRCGFETIFNVKRSDFQVNYGVDTGALGDDTKVIVSLEATTKK